MNQTTSERVDDLPVVIHSIKTFLGQHLIRAYSLPTETARSDATSFSVYHQRREKESQEAETSAPLVNFGYSKDRRPDLLQYRQMLATLNRMGMPLVSATLPGNGADDPLSRLTLTSQRQEAAFAGLYDGNPKRTTKRPTAERLLRAFCGVTLYFHRDGSLVAP